MAGSSSGKYVQGVLKCFLIFKLLDLMDLLPFVADEILGPENHRHVQDSGCTLFMSIQASNSQRHVELL